jgi:hypothetical protein
MIIIANDSVEKNYHGWDKQIFQEGRRNATDSCSILAMVC